MCLAIPARIVEIDGVMATADVGGARTRISLALVDDIAVGDFVTVHLGYARVRIDAEEARLALQVLKRVADSAAVPWPDGE